jgi:uncharacterized protein
MKSASIPGVDSSLAKKILEVIGSVSEVQEAVLFGSRAKGNFREGSDIDIALKGQALNASHCDGILRAYEDLYLPWKLDLVLYASIDEPALREHIDRVGKVLLKP